MEQIPDTAADVLEYGLSAAKPYLGTLSVTEGVVREYLKDVADLRGKANAMPAEDVQAALQTAGERLQAILYGQSDGYSSGPWNSEAHLGRALVEGAEIGGETSDAVVRVSYAIASEFGGLMQEVDEGLTEEEWKFRSDVMVEFWTHVFMGLPVPTADEED